MTYKELRDQTISFLKYKMASDELQPSDAVKLLGVLANISEEPTPEEPEDEPNLNILLPVYTSLPITVSSTTIE